MGGQFGDLDACIGADAFDFVTVGFRLGGFGQVKQPGVKGGDLHALVALGGRPFGDAFQRVERGYVASELCQENAGAFDLRGHVGTFV